MPVDIPRLLEVPLFEGTDFFIAWDRTAFKWRHVDGMGWRAW